MRCPRCGSSLYFESIQKAQQSDAAFKTEIYRICEGCGFEYDELTDASVLIFK